MNSTIVRNPEEWQGLRDSLFDSHTRWFERLPSNLESYPSLIVWYSEIQNGVRTLHHKIFPKSYLNHILTASENQPTIEEKEKMNQRQINNDAEFNIWCEEVKKIDPAFMASLPNLLSFPCVICWNFVRGKLTCQIIKQPVVKQSLPEVYNVYRVYSGESEHFQARVCGLEKDVIAYFEMIVPEGCGVRLRPVQYGVVTAKDVEELKETKKLKEELDARFENLKQRTMGE